MYKTYFVSLLLFVISFLGYCQETNSSTEEKKIEDIDLQIIEEVVIFPGCEGSVNKQSCFNSKLNQHIRKHFKYPKEAKKKKYQGRVKVTFAVDKEGNIIDINTPEPKISLVERKKRNGKLHTIEVVTPHYSLIEETKNIISKLPKMTPGMQKGKPVKTSFSTSIRYVLN